MLDYYDNLDILTLQHHYIWYMQANAHVASFDAQMDIHVANFEVRVPIYS
jgi:hypothetical protein